MGEFLFNRPLTDQPQFKRSPVGIMRPNDRPPIGQHRFDIFAIVPIERFPVNRNLNTSLKDHLKIKLLIKSRGKKSLKKTIIMMTTEYLFMIILPTMMMIFGKLIRQLMMMNFNRL